MGFNIQTNTKAKATQSLYTHIAAYMFEQEFDELKGCSKATIEALNKAKEVLAEIIKKHK